MSNRDVSDVIADALKSVFSPSVRRIEGIAREQANMLDLSTSMNLFGLPVIVAGDPYPFRGHLYNVSLMKSNGEEYFVFSVGFFEVWARVYDGKQVYEYPVIVNGLPTLSAYLVASKLQRGARVFYYLLGNPRMDAIVAHKSDVLLLDAVMRNKLPVLIIDQAKSICSDSYEGALNRAREHFALVTLSKYYHDCKHELDWLTTERNMNLARLTRCESTLREVLLRFEEARSALMELELEYRAYKSALEAYKRQFTNIEDYVTAVVSRTRELEERLKQAISVFERTVSAVRSQFEKREKEGEKEEEKEKKEATGEY